MEGLQKKTVNIFITDRSNKFQVQGSVNCQVSKPLSTVLTFKTTEATALYTNAYIHTEIRSYAVYRRTTLREHGLNVLR